MQQSNSEKLWNQLTDNIRSNFGDAKHFQLVYPTVDWEWPTPQHGKIDQKAFSIADSIPENSPVGRHFRSSKSLYNGYISVLNNVDIEPTLEEQRQYDEIQSKLTTGQNKLQDAMDDEARAWAQSGMKKSEKAKWEEETGWKKKIAVYESVVKQLEEDIESVSKQEIQVKNKKKIEDAKLPPNEKIHDLKYSKPGFALCDPGSGILEWRAEYSVPQGKDWLTQLNAGGGMTFSTTVSSNHSSSSSDDFFAGGQVSFPFFISTIDVGGQVEKFCSDEEMNSLQITISFKAITQKSVSPSLAWFDVGYLDFLKRRNKWNNGLTNDDIFSTDKGMLPMMVTGFVAGYQPSCTIKSSSAIANIQKLKIDANAGIEIGPFQFGAKAGFKKSSHTTSEDGTTITIKSVAEYPFIMGYLVAKVAE